MNLMGLTGIIGGFAAGAVIAALYMFRRWETYCSRVVHEGIKKERKCQELMLTECGLRDALQRANRMNEGLANECDRLARATHTITTDAAQYIRYLLSDRGNKIDIPDAALEEDNGMIWVHHCDETSTTTITVETPCGSLH